MSATKAQHSVKCYDRIRMQSKTRDPFICSSSVPCAITNGPDGPKRAASCPSLRHHLPSFRILSNTFCTYSSLICEIPLSSINCNSNITVKSFSTSPLTRKQTQSLTVYAHWPLRTRKRWSSSARHFRSTSLASSSDMSGFHSRSKMDRQKCAP